MSLLGTIRIHKNRDPLHRRSRKSSHIQRAQWSGIRDLQLGGTNHKSNFRTQIYNVHDYPDYVACSLGKDFVQQDCMQRWPRTTQGAGGVGDFQNTFLTEREKPYSLTHPEWLKDVFCRAETAKWFRKADLTIKSFRCWAFNSHQLIQGSTSKSKALWSATFFCCASMQRFSWVSLLMAHTNTAQGRHHFLPPSLGNSFFFLSCLLFLAMLAWQKLLQAFWV